MRNITPVVKNLLILNVVVFFACMGYDYFSGQPNLANWTFGLHVWNSPYFKPVQIITHMFMHGGFLHIFLNMYALFMFGTMLEHVWGGKRFFIFYIITGLGAAFIHLLVQQLGIISLAHKVSDLFLQNPTPKNFSDLAATYFPSYTEAVNSGLIRVWNTLPNATETALSWIRELSISQKDIPTVGASGAVFGVLLGFGMLFPNTQLMLLFPPIPIKAKYFVLGYGIIELYSGITMPGDTIAHFAHLGGMLFGYIMIRMWRKQRGNFY